MQHCNKYIAAYESDEDDAVSLSHEELEHGIQAVNDNSNEIVEENIPFPMQPHDEEPKEQKKSFSNWFSMFSSKNDDVNDGNVLIGRNDKNERIENNQNDDTQQFTHARFNPFSGRYKSASSIPFDNNANLNARFQKLQEKKKTKENKKVIKRQKINYNIVSVDLASLGNKANTVATGEHFACSNEKCKVILSEKDQLISQDNESKCDEGQKIWKCSFCNQRNIIDIDQEEIPKGETVDYILEPPVDEKCQDENLVIFVVDVSGSMSVTMEVNGKFKLKGPDLSDIAAFNEDNSLQYFPNQKRNTTWISRLQCVQAAIDDQITEFTKNKPKYKVGLVTFSNEVNIIGDGTSNPEFIAGDKLQNMETLTKIGESYKFDVSIDKSSPALLDKLYKLQENGQTALGPALVVAVAMASQKAGSQVVLCTDGLANVGLGSLDNLQSDEQKDEISKWYENVGTMALQKGVVVNVISISDGDCRLESIGKVTDVSRGTVEKINPMELKNNFKGILTKTLLATNVQATMCLHPALRFKKDNEDIVENELRKAQQTELNELFSKQNAIQVDDKDVSTSITAQSSTNENDNNTIIPQQDETTIDKESQDVGNVFEDTKIYFEYTLLKDKIKKHFSKLTDIPFQVQIHYKRMDGAKMLRIITQTKPITKDRQQVIDNLDMNIMTAHNIKKSARMCEDGDYENARTVTYSNALWMANHNNDNNPHYVSNINANNNYVHNNMALDGMMQQQQIVEQMDEFDDNSEEQKPSYFKFMQSKQKKRARKNLRDDKFSSVMYHSKK